MALTLLNTGNDRKMTLQETSHDKAQHGLRLLKEATLEYLAGRPHGVRVDALREALGLDQDSDRRGEHKFYLFRGLFNLLEKDGDVDKRLIDGRNYIFRVQQAEPKA
jgi:hypothetical protein